MYNYEHIVNDFGFEINFVTVDLARHLYSKPIQ